MSQIKIFTSVGSKYQEYTNTVRNIPKTQRLKYLKKIFLQPKSNEFFLRKFPEFPVKHTWNIQGKDLMVYRWQPSFKPKAVVINFNALNAHSGLCGDLAQKCAQLGYVFTSYDYPNFGRSSGEHRGHIESLDQLQYLSIEFLKQNTKKYSNIPIFLLGASMGGPIALKVSQKISDNIRGCIFLNPAFSDNPVNNPHLKSIIRLMGNNLPKMQTLKPLRSQSTKHSLEKYKLYDSHLYTGRLWTSTSAALLNSMQESHSKFKEFDLPFLYVQGGIDKVVNPFSMFHFQNQSPSSDKQVILINDLWHALWFDDKLPEVIDITTNWIEQRI